MFICERCNNEKTHHLCKRGYRWDRKQIAETHFNEDGTAIYRRREQEDNLIVPHNLNLLMKFRMHINVEAVFNLRIRGYLNKYFHKEPDQIKVESATSPHKNDEIFLHQTYRVLHRKFPGMTHEWHASLFALTHVVPSR